MPIGGVIEGAHDKSNSFFVTVEDPHRVGATDLAAAGAAFLVVAVAVAQVYAVVSPPVTETWETMTAR